MIKAFTIWGIILGGTFGYAYFASAKGIGIKQPQVNPPSIREGSVQDTSGKMRTRYFVGGGLHGGK
ncbi:MAG: hypothetical protein MK132_20900 [Lentisphaerales bacterium]|nr:hypothetical protein [Lentisphaerales bacterium]